MCLLPTFDFLVAPPPPSCIAFSQAGRVHSVDIPDLKHVIRIGSEQLPGTSRFSDLLEGVSDADVAAMLAEERRLDGHDPINIQFTSGTTGVESPVWLYLCVGALVRFASWSTGCILHCVHVN